MPVLANARHERFAQELAKGATQVEAYTKAGYKPNDGHAARLAGNGRVVARIEEILGRAAERAEITTARVLEELGKIGFSDIRKMFTPGGNLLPICDLDDDAAAALSSIEVVTRKVPGGEEAEVEHIAKIKVWDKRAALVDIGKHLGMFVERHEHTGKDGGPIETIEKSDRDIPKDIAFVLARGAKAQQSIN